MASDQDDLMPHRPDEQFARLQSWCRQTAPDFYADQAHYLAILREGLASAVHRSLAAWLCSLDPDRLSQVSTQERESLQARIDQLVQRCTTLLTIEQLQLLAKQLARERRLQRRQAQQAMVDALQDSTGSSDGEPTEQSSQSAQPLEAPDGSVTLSFAPPIDQPALLEGLMAPLELRDDPSDPPSDDAAALDLTVDDPLDDPVQAAEGTASLAAEGHSELDFLRSLFVMAGQSMESQAIDGHDGHDAQSSPAADDDAISDAVNTTDGPTFMPTMPLELLRWLDGLDQAIVRRLRNLSHAINVELLRAGLASSLLPMSLLDAVLSGQVETLPAPSNLLKLRVPLPMTAPGEPLIDLTCVLLRLSELEFDSASLRRSRAQLRQRRRNLLTMVRQQRHWQRRAQTQQVQTQWWPSPPTNPPPI
ncbi:MAG: hypothetical protein ACON4T_02345 [Synechococcus sp.]